MVSCVKVSLPSLNRLTTEKDKGNITGGVLQKWVQVELQEKSNSTYSGAIPSSEAYDAETVLTNFEKENLFTEEKALLILLKESGEQSKNPPFVISVESGRKEELDDFYLATKKNNLKMLVKSAQMRLPHQYTAQSWGNLRRLMREAMHISGSTKAGAVAISKALMLMQRGLCGLRYNMPKAEYKNLKKPLPMENIVEKAMATKKVASEGEKHPHIFDGQKMTGNESKSLSAQTEIGGNVDVSCSESGTVAIEYMDVKV